MRCLHPVPVYVYRNMHLMACISLSALPLIVNPLWPLADEATSTLKGIAVEVSVLVRDIRGVLRARSPHPLLVEVVYVRDAHVRLVARSS